MDQRHERMLRRDPELAELAETIRQAGSAELAHRFLVWAGERDAERRSLGSEALDRYRELNLLYDLAEQGSSLEAASVVDVARERLGRVVARGIGSVLIADEEGTRVHAFGPLPNVAPPADSILARGFVIGEGIVGGVAAGADGEIVNDPSADPRASAEELALGALMVAPLRNGGRVPGVLLVLATDGTEFTAGEHRMLSAIAALTAPALSAAIEHERSIATVRAREAELQRQLDELRSEVEERRREERVAQITGSDYFRSLRREADLLRRGLGPDSLPGDS
jgi:GAF domain-containing protein